MLLSAALSLTTKLPTVVFHDTQVRAQRADRIPRENVVGVDVAEYYERYGPMVLRRCRALLRHDEDAYDAMQEVFVNVLTKRDTLSGDAPSSLLYRIATNVCLNRIRSKKRRPEDPDDELLMRIADATNPEAHSMARRMLDTIFAREQDSTAAIAVMHLLDGMTLQEVADEVGLSVSGVRKRLRQLRGRVQGIEEL